MSAGILPISRGPAFACLLLLASACSDAGARTAEGRSTLAVDLIPESVVRLRDGDAALLAQPERLSVLPDGRFLATDFSDRNMKVYALDGRRVQTVGRVGGGPGEFASIWAGQAYGDSIIAYDMTGSRVSVFGPGGRFARALVLERRTRPKILDVRAVDDSLFLLTAFPASAAGRDLVYLVRPDGSPVASLFNPASYLADNAKLRQQTMVLADASDGVVFTALVGGDSIYAFDYAGNRLGSAAIDPVQPLVTTRTLLERSGGRDHLANGSFFSHGNRNVIALVALDSATVAMQVAPYDAVQGTDRLEGGTMIVATLRPNGGLAIIGRAEMDGGLLGSDRARRPLLLRYTSPEADAYEIVRLRFAGRPVAR